MLMSYLAMRVTRMPFNNIQELYESTFTLTTVPGSSFWDSFKYGDDLWQRIYKEKLEAFEEYNIFHTSTKEKHIQWLLLNQENAAYRNYYEIE